MKLEEDNKPVDIIAKKIEPTGWIDLESQGRSSLDQTFIMKTG